MTASDTFARANGTLGPAWTPMSVGGLDIQSGVVTGTSADASSGDIRTAETFTSNQFSQIEVTTTPLTGDQWIGAAVRAQDGGLSLYVGIYYWDGGSPVLMLFELLYGNWVQLGSTYASGPIAPGTPLTLAAVGSSLTFEENGVPRITATNSTLTGGAPGIMAYGQSTAGEWSGGDAVGTHTVGGSVSGLSGTVVLQDNATDSLSVSANGSFSFTSALPAGSTYDVTVATNPSGETCSVTDSSGIVLATSVTSVAVSCAATSSTSGSGTAMTASDTFARANGTLGPAWTPMSVGGLDIQSGVVTGTSADASSGDIRTAETFTSNQFSQIEVTTTPLTGDQWIGAAVRAQDGGLSLYVGIYYWDGGSPELMIFKLLDGEWTQLAATSCAPLQAGTLLNLTVVGSTLVFKENGTVEVSATNSTLTGGAPGIMAYGRSTAGEWSGGDAGFQVDYLSADPTAGVESFDMVSANNGYGPQILRVLQPTDPAPGVAHNFLYVLPVVTGLTDQFGDPMATLEALDAANEYNLTIIEPTFDIDPWYADNPTNPNLQYETFMTQTLVPWVTAHLSTSGTEQNWLLGFSKSGYGAQDLILKYPNLFSLAASWDFPADMSTLTQFPGSAGSYGTQTNFTQNYELTPAFVAAHAAPFKAADRIWLGGYSLYQTDMANYTQLLTSEGVLHTAGPGQYLAHSWTSGWVSAALSALYQDSLALASS